MNDVGSLRILLLQVRDDADVRREELTSFAKYAKLNLSQIDVLNVFDTPSFPPDAADGYDALFIGGASEASVLEEDKNPFLEDARNLIRQCIENKTPSFASCFGFQLAIQALGGRIIRTPEDFEMGTIPIRLHKNARHDLLFSDTPDPFLGVSVHREKATELPDGCELLAETDDCIHAFRVINAPFWAFQFHPEVDRQVLIRRLTLYKSQYTSDAAQLDSVLSSAQDTDHSNALVQKFVERVLLAV